MKKKSLLLTIATVSLLTLSIGMYVSANTAGTYKSQGSIVCTNDTADTSDDVVFDASDFDIIDTIITDGKNQLATSLNAYPNTNVSSLDTFTNLSSVIDALTDVPSGYYYDKSTEGENCERYVLENGDYYPCDKYGVKTSDTPLAGEISVVSKGSTATPGVGETHLVKYVGADESNLSAGYAGYVEKKFVLGSGSDNIVYKDRGYDEGYADFESNAKIVFSPYSFTVRTTYGSSNSAVGTNADETNTLSCDMRAVLGSGYGNYTTDHFSNFNVSYTLVSSTNYPYGLHTYNYRYHTYNPSTGFLYVYVYGHTGNTGYIVTVDMKSSFTIIQLEQ